MRKFILFTLLLVFPLFSQSQNGIGNPGSGVGDAGNGIGTPGNNFGNPGNGIGGPSTALPEGNQNSSGFQGNPNGDRHRHDHHPGGRRNQGNGGRRGR